MPKHHGLTLLNRLPTRATWAVGPTPATPPLLLLLLQGGLSLLLRSSCSDLCRGVVSLAIATFLVTVVVTVVHHQAARGQTAPEGAWLAIELGLGVAGVGCGVPVVWWV